jgi:hypothetical protein
MADTEAAAEVRAAGCPHCGAPLHAGNYTRKPRAGPAVLPDGYERAFSFCCSSDDCRKRRLPPSLRFLGRRVYVSAIVVLATAMMHGVTPWRAARLRELTGASLRTLARWRRWWTDTFPRTSTWKQARGLLRAPVDESALPLSLLEVFAGEGRARLMALLRLLRPLTTTAPPAHAE